MKAFMRNRSAATTARYRTEIKQWTVIGCGLLLSACIGSLASAQTAKPSTIRPAVDQGVAFPPLQPLLTVRQDPTALAIVRSYQKAVGNAAWADMEATGEMIPEALRSAGETPGQDATLWISGQQRYRVDVQTPKGAISIRMDGVYGAMQPPGGHIIPMDARDAVTGLVAFPQFEGAAFPAGNASLIDRGTVPVDGTKLQRVTAEVPWMDSAAKDQPQSGVSITDLYFDPTTHLLIKSANVLQGTDPGLSRDIKVITYGDYRTVDGVQIPFLLSESLNGKRIWTLHLSRVQFRRGMSEVNFRF